jgi:peptidyl-prolyl cis-trans isomerase C
MITKKFPKKGRLITTLLILIIALIAAILVVAGVSYKKSHRVIAKVNGEKIYQSDLEDKLTKMFQNQEQPTAQKIVIEDFPSQVVEALVQDVYLQKKLDKIARKSKIAKDPTLKKQITENKNSILRQAYLENLVANKVNEQTIKDKYSELSAELSGKKEMHIKHILVANIEDASKVTGELKSKKSSFEQLAKKHSIDTANASVGGDLGYVIPDNLDENFAKTIVGLKKGQVSGPIKTQFGWHIIYVQDIRDINFPSFDNAKSGIEEQLKQEAVEELFSSITKNAKIKILIKLKSPEENKTPAPEAATEEGTEEGRTKDEKKSEPTKDATK